MNILGLHHITLVCSNAQRTVDFYTRVLGLRLIKQTVNFDDPTSYHLYFGDHQAHPGSAVTFFEWPQAHRGYPGIGGTHHFALTVAHSDGLRKWKRRLSDMGIRVADGSDPGHFPSIQLNDPDGVVLEIATGNEPATGAAVEPWPEAVLDTTADMALHHGMHHITAISSDLARTEAFFSGVLGLKAERTVADESDPKAAHRYWAAVDGGQSILTYMQRSPKTERHMRMGAGQTHHFAFAVPDEESQQMWREQLIRARFRVTPIIDRVYFRSVYTNDPDGHIVELATLGPGFAVDEDPRDLGRSLKLPPWLEGSRPKIERGLRPLDVPQFTDPEAVELALPEA